MDVHHTFVLLNQEFNYSSLLETGICNNATLQIHYSSTICRNDSKLGMQAEETSDFKTSNLHFSVFVNG
jgi:hypothetical protein